MNYRCRLIALTVFAATSMAVSAQPVAKTATASKAWKQPMTPWGDPDLQGVWPSTSMIQTPMERDPKLGTRAVLNDEEVAQKAARDKQFHQLETCLLYTSSPLVDLTGLLNANRAQLAHPPRHYISRCLQAMIKSD